MWRLHGIYRYVTLWSAPQTHIRDFFVKTDLDKYYQDAVVSVEAKVKNYGEKNVLSNTILATLYDRKGKEIGKASAVCKALKVGEEERVEMKFVVVNPDKWTAETPNLYTLVLTGTDGEILSSKIGFRKLEIDGRVFKVNGVPIKLKGVNRHEHWSDVGHAINEEQMIKDLTLIKQGNCNHVRTCHYSDDPRWYELCDEWGIWLVAEVNLECHGYDGKFDNEPTMKAAIVDRNVANVENFKNHPSVIIWSLGNECGGVGKNFVEAMNKVKSIDPTRFVHYERFWQGKNNPSDFDGQMYGSPKNFKDVALNSSLTKTFYICEYAHAMFNSMGSLKEYSDVFDQHPEILGGAIWEFQDQALWNNRNPSHPILAYGGGFGEFPNNDYFIHKGVVAWDRVSVKPHYPEMKKAYQWIDSKLFYSYSRWIDLNNEDAGLRTLEIHNKYQFISLDSLEGRWSLTDDGVEIESGKFIVPHIDPLKKNVVAIPYKLDHPKSGSEYFIRISYHQKNRTLWAEKGYEVASEQIKLPVNSLPIAVQPVGKHVSLKQNAESISVVGDNFSVSFSKKSGLLTSLMKNGENLFTVDGAPKLHLWRAPHQDDVLGHTKHGLNTDLLHLTINL